MPENIWLLLGLGAAAAWALTRGTGNGGASELQELGLGSIVGSAMAATGVEGPTDSPIDPQSPVSILLVSDSGQLFEAPPQGVPAAVANDEDIGVLPLEGRYSAENRTFIGGDSGAERKAPLAEEQEVVQPAPKTSTLPYQFRITPDYLFKPVEGQTFTTPVGVDTTIQIIESPVASHSFHTKPSVLRDYLAQFD